MAETLRRELTRAAVRLTAAEREVALARLNVERELARWRGHVAIREMARKTGLSAATLSNLFRGRLVVSAANLTKIIRLLPTTETAP